MTAPVDALAVLRRMHHTCDLDRRDNQIDRFAKLDADMADEELEAIAGVAELVEACAPVLRHDPAFDTGPEAHLRAALARVQGGAK